MNPNPNPSLNPNNPNEAARPASTADLVRAARAVPATEPETLDRPEAVPPQRPDGGDGSVRHMEAPSAAAAAATRMQQQPIAAAATEAERPVALFPPDVCQHFRAHWDEVQIGFVDDPLQSVKRADELVAQVMTSLAATFARERAQLENFMATQGQDGPDTENLRVALRRYRSFFQRLLTL